MVKKICLMLTAFIVVTIGCSQTSFRGPGQAKSGPGSSEYAHQEIAYERYGEKQFQYFIFIPQKPILEKAPVIAFLHGWGAMSPYSYGGWIRHLVLRGNIVVYPRMQSSVFTDNGGITYTAIDSLKDAFKQLEKGKIRPDKNRFAVIGHSAGGNAAINVAALAEQEGLPLVKAVMCVQPGLEYSKSGRKWTVLENLSLVPAKTLLLITLGDQDDFVEEIDARKIFNRTKHILEENKDYIMLISDNYGKPQLKAIHDCAKSPDPQFKLPLRNKKPKEVLKGVITPVTHAVYPTEWVNALDYYGLWKMFDGLYETAFYGKNRKYALGNARERKYMGLWEDGTPIKEIKVLPGPTALK